MGGATGGEASICVLDIILSALFSITCTITNIAYPEVGVVLIKRFSLSLAAADSWRGGELELLSFPSTLCRSY